MCLNKSPFTSYGLLYNFYCVSSDKLAPKGWHVSTDSDWTLLITYLGGEEVAGGKLKETGLTHWNPPNTGANNEKGFSAVPGGYRNSNGVYSAIGKTGFWWTTKEADSLNSWRRYMSCDSAKVSRKSDRKVSGLSVRCVKD